jgi:hypothetical protein
MLKTATEQNCFQFHQQYYKQIEGLAVDAPTFEILAEAYLQHMEHEQLHPILIKCQLILYCRYIGDILIIYSQMKTNIG